MQGRVSRFSSDWTRAAAPPPPPLPEDSPPSTPLPPAHTPSQERAPRCAVRPNGTNKQPAAPPPDAMAPLFSPVIDSSIPWGPPKAPLPHYPPPKTPLPPPDSPVVPPPPSPLDGVFGSLSLAQKAKDAQMPLEEALGSLSLADDAKEPPPPLPDYTPPTTPLPPSPSQTPAATSDNPDRTSSPSHSRSSTEGRGAAQDGGALSLSPEDAEPSRHGVDRGSSSAASSGISLKKNPRLFAPRVSFPLEPKGGPGKRQPRVAAAQARPHNTPSDEPLRTRSDGSGNPDAIAEKTSKHGCGSFVGCEVRHEKPHRQQQENRNPSSPEGRLRRSRAAAIHYLVVDTNTFLDDPDFATIQRIVETQERRREPWAYVAVVCVIPQEVVRELDGLKRATDNGRGMRARRAANFVLEAVRRRSEWVMMEEGGMRFGRPDPSTTPDDRILQFAASMASSLTKGGAGPRFLQCEDGGQITLVSNDRVMQIKAAGYHLRSGRASEILEWISSTAGSVLI